MLNFSTPVQEIMYCVPQIRKKRVIKFKDIQSIFTHLEEDWKGYFDRYVVKIAYKTELEAFKAQLCENEQNLSEAEITQKYPYWKKRIYYFNTENWLVFGQIENRAYLMEGIKGKIRDIFYVCHRCSTEKHIREFDLKTGSISNHPFKFCKKCQFEFLEYKAKKQLNKIINDI